MINFPCNVKLYLATEHTDLRRTFNGLSALVEGSFGMDARSGDLFIFLNRRATQVRILFWERDGFCILMKRLEEGSFSRVKKDGAHEVMEIDAGELAMMLEGIEATQVKRKKRYQHSEKSKEENLTMMR